MPLGQVFFFVVLPESVTEVDWSLKWTVYGLLWWIFLEGEASQETPDFELRKCSMLIGKNPFLFIQTFVISLIHSTDGG